MIYPNRKLRRPVVKLSDELVRLSTERVKSVASGQAALSLVVPHLDPQLVPTTGNCTVAEQESVELALSSIRLLANIIFHANLNTDEHTWPQVLELWPSIWKWHQYLLEYGVEKAGNGPKDIALAKLVVRIIGTSLKVYTTSDDAQAAIVNTPGLLGTMTHYWIQEDSTDLFGGEHWFTIVLWRLLSVTFNLDEVLDVGNGRKNVVKLALRRLREQMDRPKLDDESLSDVLSLVQYLLRNRAHEMPLLFAHAGLIPQVIECIRLLNKKLPRGPYSQNERLCVMVCSVLVQNTATLNGPRWVALAIKSGLIPAWLEAAKFTGGMRRGDLELSGAFLPRVIVPYLSYRRVVRAASQVLAEDRSLDQDAYAGPQGQVWPTIRAMIKARQAVKEDFDEEYFEQCAACLQDKRLCSDGLKTCAGCHGPRYCSYGCQSKSWPAHKQTCLAEQDGTSKEGELLFYEVLFIRKVAADEIHRHRDMVNTYLRQNYARMDWIFQVNLLQMPAEVSVEECNADTLTKHSFFGAADPNDKRLLVQIVCRVGMHDHTFTDGILLPEGIEMPAA